MIMIALILGRIVVTCHVWIFVFVYEITKVFPLTLLGSQL